MNFNKKVEDAFDDSRGVREVRIVGVISNRKSRREMDALLFAIEDYVNLKNCLE